MLDAEWPFCWGEEQLLLPLTTEAVADETTTAFDGVTTVVLGVVTVFTVILDDVGRLGLIELADKNAAAAAAE